MVKEILLSREKLEMSRPTFILLLGPSGAGKTTLIQSLIQKDARFRFVQPLTDRPPRQDEIDKRSISPEVFTQLENGNYFLLVNHIYGNRYGTPRNTIDQILEEGNIPLLDFPLSAVHKLNEYEHILYKIYITPPSLSSLIRRLKIDGRIEDGNRYKDGKAELMQLVKCRFIHPDIDDVLINRDLALASRSLLTMIYERISGKDIKFNPAQPLVVES